MLPIDGKINPTDFQSRQWPKEKHPDEVQTALRMLNLIAGPLMDEHDQHEYSPMECTYLNTAVAGHFGEVPQQAIMEQFERYSVCAMCTLPSSLQFSFKDRRPSGVSRTIAITSMPYHNKGRTAMFEQECIWSALLLATSARN